MLGAGWIAERAMLPALAAAVNAAPVAIAARDPGRAAALASAHGVARVLPDYASLVADPGVDAVYIALPNSLHHPWALRALAAGKHVLCEKPMALDAAEAEEMAAAAASTGRALMEAVMYRFHPRVRSLVSSLEGVAGLHAAFGFPLDAPDNYRLRPELGGGALLDVGCYGVDVARWVLGEPERVAAAAHLGPTGVDLSCAAVLGFEGGALATITASFETAEHQELVAVGRSGVVRLERPFTAWRDPDDPYQLMVEAFGAHALGEAAHPLPPSSSVANMRVLDRIRAACS